MIVDRRRFALVAVLLVVAAGAASGSTAPAYIRFPDISGNRIVFAAEGDLWVVGDQGGSAKRLTSHPGVEYFPRFSPDGTLIAFTGEYDGNQDVYVIPAEGGEPRRLTWHPGADQVIGWTADGKKVLFRSGAENPNGTELFAVGLDGSDPEKLPLGWAARLAIDPDTGMWAFNRVSVEGRTWKRYRGGRVADIWIGQPERADFRKVTKGPASAEYPMWYGGRVYFLCDEGGTANIWSMRPDGSDRTRHTDLKDWDARWPSMSRDGRVAFTLGADIHIFNANDGSVRKVDVELPSDRRLTRVRYPEPGRDMTWLEIAPKGDRIVVVTRGEAFTVPVKDGPTMPVTKGSGARESWASFSPDGKRLVYVTDEPREEEIRTADAWGRGAENVVKAAGASGWHFPPRWSPDGKLIAYSDQTQSLWVVSAEGGAPKLADRCEQAEIRDYVWSPDGRFLAYSKVARTGFASIYIYGTKDASVHRATGPFTNDFSPAWDPQGRYLYFLSSRVTNPIPDTVDLNVIEARDVVPILLLLRPDIPNPFAALKGLPEEGEKEGEKAADHAKKTEEKQSDAKDAGKEQKGEAPPTPVEIDFNGLADRFVQLPGVEPGSYFAARATSKFVYFLSAPLKGMRELPGIFDEAPPDATLISYDLEKKKTKTFTEGVGAYTIALKADKVAIMKKRGEVFVFDAGATAGDAGEAKVSLDGVVVELEPRKEWAQIYWEAWRHQRDFYWDAGMAGVDWPAVGRHYATLLPRLATRSDLQDLIGEMISELCTSHTYVMPGDPGVRVPRVSTGLVGADVVREGDAYKVARLLHGDPADNVRSPLAEPGVNVAEGDFILAVNHHPFRKDAPFYAAFEGLANKDIVLTVNSKPSEDGVRDVVVHTLEADNDLRYANWVRRNREHVAAKTGGKIGYIHIPDMLADGMARFNTWYFPQLDKEGLIIDGRWNRGGNTSEIVLERLRRKVLAFQRARGGAIGTYPVAPLNGPFVVLMNQYSGSDGDIFPAAVQLEKLAPLIGERTWGGVVGCRCADKPMVDGGLLTQPEFAWNDPRLGWTIENRGVEPEIEVETLPQELAKGVDAQLDRAIAEVLKLRDQHPPQKPRFDPARPRDRAAFADELARH